MSDFTSETTHRAAKDHQCQECYDGIKNGDTYTRIAGVFDGSFYSARYCQRCTDAIARAYADHILEWDEGFDIGGFWSHVKDAVDYRDWESWNMPKEWTHRLEVWLTPDCWMTKWAGIPGMSTDKEWNKNIAPHDWLSDDTGRKGLAKLDPDGTRFPTVDFRWVRDTE